MTHFGLGSSGEDPWGSLLGGLGVGLPSQEPALSAWEAVLFPWEAQRAHCLAECMGLCLPDFQGGCYLLGKDVFPSRGVSGGLAACLGGSAVTRNRENCLSCC